MKMRTKDNRPTAYAMACGCIETYRIGNFSGRFVRHASARVYCVTEDGDDARVIYNGPSIQKARQRFDASRKIAQGAQK